MSVKEVLPRCGNCKYASAIPQDLNLRACKGGPPQAILMPGHGGVQMQYVYPVVNSTNDPCAFHRFKVIDGEISNV